MIPPEVLDRWPNCSVPDCCNKVWLGGKVPSDKCYPHTHNLKMALNGSAIPPHIQTSEEADRISKRLNSNSGYVFGENWDGQG